MLPMLPVIGAPVADLGLFFVGLNFLTEHLKMLSGRRLRERIATWTKRPLMGSFGAVCLPPCSSQSVCCARAWSPRAESALATLT